MTLHLISQIISDLFKCTSKHFLVGYLYVLQKHYSQVPPQGALLLLIAFVVVFVCFGSYLHSLGNPYYNEKLELFLGY